MFSLGRNWKYVKRVIGVVTSASAFSLAYQISKISHSRLNLDVIELERNKRSYLERLAVIARTGGPQARHVAIDRLSRSHDLPDELVHRVSLACDCPTLLQLAAKKGVDVRLFLPPSESYDEGDNLSSHIYRLVERIQHSEDSLVQDLSVSLLNRTPPAHEELAEEDEDDEDIFASEMRPRKSDLSPPAQTLASLTKSFLEIIIHYTSGEDDGFSGGLSGKTTGWQRAKPVLERSARHHFIHKENGLQLLAYIWHLFTSNDILMCKLADILLNLTLDDANHPLLVTDGFLHILVVWIRSGNLELKAKAASALSNVSQDSIRYQPSTHLLHPVPEDLSQVQTDVVLVHGLNGSSFYTWRQHPSMKHNDDYSMCWPIDWLSEDFDARVRTVGVELVSHATSWSIADQAKAIADHLCDCKLGDGRKVVWIGHSMGGILIKHIISMATDEPKYSKLLHNTSDVLFLGVPHRGCPVAHLTNWTSYIASPSVQVQELADTANMHNLNERFVEVARRRKINCLNLMEGEKTQLRYNVRLHVVPPEYSELEVGENILMAEDNHMTICKPKNKDSRLYTSLAAILKRLLHLDAADVEG